MKVVVQKFGGTCVESDANQQITAERLMEARDRGLHPVAVISAMGREGQPYSTVELVKTVQEIHPDMEPRDLDLLMSCGEIISTVAMAHLLRAKGYETIALTGGQAGLITDEHYGRARIVRLRPDMLLQALQDGCIVFCAGFQGISEAHQVTTLGAGGSDYTAVALAWIINETPKLPFGEKLEVAPLQIFKEVDGVMSANPKSLAEGESAQTIPHLTYDECVVMSRLGAEVLQHQAAEMAREHRIAINVRNFRIPDHQGTHVGASSSAAGPDCATAVADQAQLIVFDAAEADPRLAMQIGERLGRERLTYFEVATDAPGVRFAVRPLKYCNVEGIVRRVLETRGVSAEVNVGNLAMVSVVGESLRLRLDGWDDRARKTLAEAKIGLHGASRDEISLSYLVAESDRIKAVTCLHQQLVR
jgi:aspartate kinase